MSAQRRILATAWGLLAVAGSVRPAAAQVFDPTFLSVSIDNVWKVALQPDGKILAGGVFSHVNGVTKQSLVRLNADGSLDSAFAAEITLNGSVGIVAQIEPLPDGRILVGGSFGQVGSTARANIARLLADGTLDTTFSAATNGMVSALVVQPDGRIVVGGNFTSVNGVTRTHVARLNANGTLDDGFAPPVSQVVRAIAREANGSLLLSGDGLERVTADGALDSTFTPVITPALSAAPLSIVVRPDGRILIGGYFESVNSVARSRIAQLNPDGTLDSTFDASVGGAGSVVGVRTMALQPDGRLVFGGWFDRVGAVPTNSVVRVLADGSIDSSFGSPAVPPFVHTPSIALQPDGRILAAYYIDATSSTKVARLLPTPTSTPPTPGDTDADALLDEWETRFGLNPNSSTGVDGPNGDPDGDGLTNAQELAAGTHPRGFHVSYLAEGARNAFFDARLAVLNVGNGQGRLLFRFLQAGGAVMPHFVELPQNRRLTIGNDVLAALNSPDFSTVLESDQPIVLDRTMTWNGGLGSHAETGVPSPSSTWYLAEGSTAGDFSLFYLLQNPNPIATVATVRYLLPFGQPPIERTYTLAPSSRTTIPVDEQGAALTATDVSAVITTPADAPIIVERAMYRSTRTTAFIAGHGSAGVTAPATAWFLAEGATGVYFDCFILLANPNAQAATVAIDYLLDDGRTFTKQYTVPAQGRFTVWVDDEQIPAGSGVRPLQTVAVSSTVTSDVPIIVERTMWWPSPGFSANFWTEAHNSPGAIATGTRWALAEGEVGGAQSAETYILIANTSTTPGVARVTLYFANGASAVRTFPLLPRSRRNVSVSADFASRPTTAFSAVIESLPSGSVPAAEIVVERAMYTSPGGRVWEAGTNALGTRLTSSP